MPDRETRVAALDREKTELQETGRLTVRGLSFKQLAEIVASLGFDPGHVTVDASLRVEDMGTP